MNLKTIQHHPTARFLLMFGGLFAILYYFTIIYTGLVAPGGYYIPFLAEYFNFVEGLRSVLLHWSESILNFFGYQTFTHGIWFRVIGHGGFNLAYSCLGFGVMSFFAAFVIAFPKPIKSKLWFLPAGILLIQTLNIVRFVLLGLYWKHSHLKTLIDHHDLFNIVLYIVLITVLYLWINSDTGTRKTKAIERNPHERNTAPQGI